MREVGLESNKHVLEFAAKVLEGAYDLIIFTTGAGVRAMLEIVQTRYDREEFLTALRTKKIAARGPKPSAVLRELNVTVDVIAQEPSTWHELVAAIDAAYGDSLKQMHVAVQEYGVSNPELLAALNSRCREVTKIAVYRWALPENLEPLRECVRDLLQGIFDVVLLMTAAQIIHLFQVADMMGVENELSEALRKTIVISIGPSTTEAMAHYGIEPNFEPSRPKMGFMINEAAAYSSKLLG
jgi:uroporphyrinogen-III synthase